MRRLALAAALAASMVLAWAPAATAATDPFSGVWISIDLYDGSTQMLVVSGGSVPAVTYQDFFARTCATAGSMSTHWVANGRGEIQEFGMLVQFSVAGCGGYRAGAYPAWYFFEAGVLTDNFGNAWYRLS